MQRLEQYISTQLLSDFKSSALSNVPVSAYPYGLRFFVQTISYYLVYLLSIRQLLFKFSLCCFCQY